MPLRNINITKDFCQDIFDYMYYNELHNYNNHIFNHSGFDVLDHVYKDKQRCRNLRFNEMHDIIREKSIIAINNVFHSIQTTYNKDNVYIGKDDSILWASAFDVYCKIYLGYDVFLCIRYNIDNYEFVLRRNLNELIPIFEKYYE